MGRGGRVEGEVDEGEVVGVGENVEGEGGVRGGVGGVDVGGDKTVGIVEGNGGVGEGLEGVGKKVEGGYEEREWEGRKGEIINGWRKGGMGGGWVWV